MIYLALEGKEDRHKENTYLVVSARVTAPRALMAIVAIPSATFHALAAWDSSGDIAQRVPHLRVELIVVVFAVVHEAGGSQVVFVTELAVLDAGFESLLFLGRWRAKTTVDSLACTIYWDTLAVAGRRVFRSGNCNLRGGSFLGGCRNWWGVLSVSGN
jgi:hypothetical protein